MRQKLLRSNGLTGSATAYRRKSFSASSRTYDRSASSTSVSSSAARTSTSRSANVAMRSANARCSAVKNGVEAMKVSISVVRGDYDHIASAAITFSATRTTSSARDLTNCFVKSDGDRVCKVQAANFWIRHRSEERRVGKECRSRWATVDYKRERSRR